MAYPTAVNSQITDAVTQPNVKVLGDAPAIALGNLYQATAQALANAAHNATSAQQQTNISAQAATTSGGLSLGHGGVDPGLFGNDLRRGIGHGGFDGGDARVAVVHGRQHAVLDRHRLPIKAN